MRPPVDYLALLYSLTPIPFSLIPSNPNDPCSLCLTATNPLKRVSNSYHFLDYTSSEPQSMYSEIPIVIRDASMDKLVVCMDGHSSSCYRDHKHATNFFQSFSERGSILGTGFVSW